MKEDFVKNGQDPVKTESVPEHPDEFLFDYCPWLFFKQASKRQRDIQTRWLAMLSQDGKRLFGIDCFVSRLAAVFTDKLVMGDGSYIAAHAYLTGNVIIGADCTINPYTVIRGPVTMGDGVRIGTHSSIIGFNHDFSDVKLPMHIQGISSIGVTFGNDIWIGSNVTILDGVTIGDHSIVAAGAVVTRNVQPFTVVGGVPAKLLRHRIAEDPSVLRHRLPEENVKDSAQRTQDQPEAVSNPREGVNKVASDNLQQPIRKPAYKRSRVFLKLQHYFRRFRLLYRKVYRSKVFTIFRG